MQQYPNVSYNILNYLFLKNIHKWTDFFWAEAKLHSQCFFNQTDPSEFPIKTNTNECNMREVH